MKIAVMTDSTSYLSQDLIDKYNIQIAPLKCDFLMMGRTLQKVMK